ncbi:hypothetical protein [Agrobacterium sp. NCPPB 925]|uniref:hypothetical protein n=1 Tax=Agrobacterium TaxID=357 RepID=UPI0009CC2940|nr:hypothetical protein AGR6A_pTi0116 [Agrobacterium sp. NCPPB 925]
MIAGTLSFSCSLGTAPSTLDIAFSIWVAARVVASRCLLHTSQASKPGRTSYPPGDQADEAQLTAIREAITDAFKKGNGVLEIKNESGMFITRKSA